ncbi:AraC family transcriptional regulator [Rhodocyclaceae bacterium]|nr:AraC family transcriptional regulator [Rhodocyclaceae bacterium]
MELHTTAPVCVLRRSHRLSLDAVGTQAAQAYADLHAEAQARGLTVNGPPIFAARGLPQQAHTPFDLDFCLPVEGAGLPMLPALRCARRVYEGPLSDLFSQGYQPLLHAMAEAGLRASGDSREVYHVWHGPDAPDNRIEIQIGIVE